MIGGVGEQLHDTGIGRAMGFDHKGRVDVAINPDLSADLFTLQVPEGTRVLRRTVKKE